MSTFYFMHGQFCIIPILGNWFQTLTKPLVNKKHELVHFTCLYIHKFLSGWVLHVSGFPLCLYYSCTSKVIAHYPTRDQCLALSSTLVLLFNVINVMYAWLHMHFVSSLMLTIKHHLCLPAMSKHLLMTPALSINHHVETDKLWF